MKEFPVYDILPILEKEDNFVLLESARCDQENRRSYLFLRPRKIIWTSRPAQVGGCLTELDNALRAGCYTAGFFSYEAGAAFEERLSSKQDNDFPLLWFGVYQEPVIFDHVKGCFSKSHFPPAKRGGAGNYKKKNYALEDIKPNVSPAEYKNKISAVKRLIARGLTYQVNYTFKLKFAFSGSPFSLYLDLREKQSVAYSALIKMGGVYALSFSPELFFRKNGADIIARPMKGTSARGRNIREDARMAEELKNCPKNRSENLMIVDLLRNDLGRISAVGSVRVPCLFNVEKYPTLFQLTSDISGSLVSAEAAFDIFRQIFPSGSVTGAPKIKTMEIISRLEKERRGIYTGSIGFFSPRKTGVFNVAIRTVLINKQQGKGEMGVGSGIVYDSSAPAEYAECCLKANFLTNQIQRFQLIETMLWQPEKGFLFLTEHLKRLRDSACYFDFDFNLKQCREALKKLGKRLPCRAHKARLLLSKKGEADLEAVLLPPTRHKKPGIVFSREKVDSEDVFLYHKTTNRKLYDAEYRRARSRGFYDVIFSNEKGEITEGAISNIVIK
ncbi:MAG: aminodeoxychorismate synthase component I, partial [Candidatus Omnitrophota bacterium]